MYGTETWSTAKRRERRLDVNEMIEDAAMDVSVIEILIMECVCKEKAKNDMQNHFGDPR